jgi:general secretion pathway protein D
MIRAVPALLTALMLLAATGALQAQEVAPVGADSLSIRLRDVSLRNVVEVLSPYLNRPVVIAGPAGPTVTIETPRPIPKADVERLLRGVLQSNGFSLEIDTIAQLFRVTSQTSAAPTPTLARSAAAQSSAGMQLFVIALQHARAGDVASTINALYGRGGSPMADVAQTATLSEELRGNLVPPEGASTVAANAAAPRRSGQLSGELVIVADPRANSLLVRATAADLELIQGVVTALDVRPLQVMIEVLIAEVRRDRSVGINVEAELSPTDVGKSGGQIEAALGEAGLGDFALRVMGVGGLDLATTLRLASGRGNVRILTRPVVLATNNQSAEIVVGSQRPFVQVSRALPTDGATRDQVVQYKDVGTKLVVTPTISQDGSVQLEVTQEVSTATSELAFNAPVIATRSVRTQLLVRDGQTVALGGLTDRQREARQGGVPILSSIPLLGGLFGRASRQSIETELFVFLTPHVIRTDEDAAAQTAPMSERVVPPDS